MALYARAKPDAPQERRASRAFKAAFPFVVAIVAAFFLWPSSLGGGTTLTVVSGHSMEPRFHTGDLVIARRGHPHVGQIVVYAPPGVGGARIIHRIVGGDSAGWKMKGDNNDFVDPFSPTDAQVVGIARVHLPKVGLVARVVKSPLVWLSVIALALAILAWPARRDDDDDTDDETVADDAQLEAGQLGDAGLVEGLVR